MSDVDMRADAVGIEKITGATFLAYADRVWAA